MLSWPKLTGKAEIKYYYAILLNSRKIFALDNKRRQVGELKFNFSMQRDTFFTL